MDLYVHIICSKVNYNKKHLVYSHFSIVLWFSLQISKKIMIMYVTLSVHKLATSIVNLHNYELYYYCQIYL